MLPSSERTEVYRGYFIGTFHLNHFYPEDGQGHWWVESDEATWPQVWAHAVGDPPVVTVYMEVEGDLLPNIARQVTSPEGDPVRIPARGATDKRLILKQIRDIRPIPRDDFNRHTGFQDD
jgi:hypothetical protein